MSKNSLYQSNELYDIIKFNDREDWLNAREGCITASDSACIVEKHPYKTLEQYIEEWKNPVDVKTSKAMQYGLDAELPLRRLFELDYLDKYQLEYQPDTIVFNKKYPFLSCSPDALFVEVKPKSKKRKGILELKTTFANSPDALANWNAQIPNHYYIQVLHQLVVMEDVELAILRAKIKYYDKDVKTYHYLIKDYLIERESVEADIEYLRSEEIAFKGKHSDLAFRSV